MAKMTMIEKEKYEMPEDEGMYPYGTQIILEGMAVDDLDLDSIMTGATVSLKVSAMISRRSEEAEEPDEMESEGPIEKKVCLQITKITMIGEEKPDRAVQMYGESEGE